jgi:hypothetical protein
MYEYLIIDLSSHIPINNFQAFLNFIIPIKNSFSLLQFTSKL